MKIFNYIQADKFIKYGAIPTGMGLGNKNKTYLEFEDNEKLKELLKKWTAREI